MSTAAIWLLAASAGLLMCGGLSFLAVRYRSRRRAAGGSAGTGRTGASDPIVPSSPAATSGPAPVSSPAAASGPAPASSPAAASGPAPASHVTAESTRWTATRRSLIGTVAAAAVLPAAGPLAFGRSVAAAAALASGDRGRRPAPWDPARGVLIRGATVVTMDDQHTVFRDGQVLVRAGRIAAIWSGPVPPAGVVIGSPSIIDADPGDLLFPGLINLHDHPSEDFLYLVLPPSSDAIPEQGKAGPDPYANRYQWNSATMPPEFHRLLSNPVGVLSAASGLGLETEILKYAQVGALLGGETATQGAPENPASDNAIIRSIDNNAFNTRVGPPRVDPIATFADPQLTQFIQALQAGSYDAWMIHLAEGVRDGDRRPGDTFSSRAEFATLKAKGLLTDTTVIIHGTALESADFAAMREAPTIRIDGVTDGLGAKLVWSPQSNLVLYGKTTNVYEALAAGVLVSLGTDWTASGSRSLLHELKIRALYVPDLGDDDDFVAFEFAGSEEFF